MDTNMQSLTPNRHIMAIFTFVVLFPLVYYIPPWLTRNVTDDQFYVTVLAVGIIVPIVSYVAIPLLCKLFTIFHQNNGN